MIQCSQHPGRNWGARGLQQGTKPHLSARRRPTAARRERAAERYVL